MCYYVTSKLSATEIAGLEHDFVLKWEEQETTPYYVAAGFAYPKLPVITAEPRFRLLQWGLIPNWQKDWENASKFRMQTLNAISETVESKPSFRGAIKAGRTCVVPVNGFFEWHHGEKEKYPHFIFPRHDQVFLLAGVYEHWTNPALGEQYETFSILTTEANERMSWIHNSKKRMPAILSLPDAKLWLDKSVPFKAKKHVLRPFDQERMADHTISRLITSRKQNPNSPEVMEPFKYPEIC
jgi:putative SOS response-associated peptidase YedK